MKVNDYKCNMCGAKLVDTEELIGLGIKDASHAILAYEYYPKYIEKAEYHICSDCILALKDFTRIWETRDKMSPAAKHAWGLNW